jgi:hypothetical protein
LALGVLDEQNWFVVSWFLALNYCTASPASY